MGLIGCYLRSTLDDTPVYEEMNAAETSDVGSAAAAPIAPTASVAADGATVAPPSLADLFRTYREHILVLTVPVISVNVVKHTLLSFLPRSGAISDRYGRKPSWYFSLGRIILLAIGLAMLGFAITYNIATSVFGGTAALVNEWAIGVTGDVRFSRTT